MGNRDVYEFLNEQNIDILAEIPFNKAYAGKYASGDLLTDIDQETTESYKKIVKSIEERYLQYEGSNYFKW
ncbi:hypothetical protein [Marinilabilia salmonicolor]|uniref:hypothetical protein n=1 Tax=Marinilabilia salmonicolor TaxID=989 RepID=UPI001F3E7D11|nr:hypothetical protein [Marinilabilia salmonicolor]